jgi:hypothetical protein
MFITSYTMSFDTKNYRTLKATIQETERPFTAWKQWTGSFSASNNYPVASGAELTLLNRSTQHCVCGHRCGKRDSTNNIGMLSTPDVESDPALDAIHNDVVANVRGSLSLSRSYMDSSLLPYFKGDKFILVGKTCVRHFTEIEETEGKKTKDRKKIIYERTGNQTYTLCIPLVLDQSGILKKIREVSAVRHLPDNMFYFAECIGFGVFEISKSLDPYGFKDICGISQLISRKNLSNPITVSEDVATIRTNYNGIEVGDTVYLSLMFVNRGDESVCIIKEHNIYYHTPTISALDIETMRSIID